MSENTLSPVQFIFESEEFEAHTWNVYSLDLEEGINRCHRVKLGLVCDDTQNDANPLLGDSATLTIHRPGSLKRTVSGIVTRLHQESVVGNSRKVLITLEPALQILDLHSSCRYFQDMSVASILEEVLEERLQPFERKFENRLEKRGQATRDYCVQYNESDLAFVERLMQEEGINYYFDHEINPKQETLVLFDEANDLPEAKNVDGSNQYFINAASANDRSGKQGETEMLSGFRRRSQLTTTTAKRSDWDWEQNKVLNAAQERSDDRSRNRSQHFALGRRFHEDDLDDRATDYADTQQLFGHSASGEAPIVSLAPGLKFEPVEVDVENGQSTAGQLIVLSQTVTGSTPDYVDPSNAEQDAFRCSFQAVSAKAPLRPRNNRKRPLVYGPQTAIVCGPDGSIDTSNGAEEIETDKHGRIRVKFHWELEEDCPPSNDVLWVRVSQTWAGPGWGTQFIPRVGMEVIVEFLEGNPDRPLVTGCVYNGNNKPPFSLPDDRTKSGIKTSSSPGGKDKEYNEISFSDDSGKEVLHIRAQRDFDQLILRNLIQQVDQDLEQTIGANKTVDISDNLTETVGGSMTTSVSDKMTLEVKGDYGETIHKKKTVNVEADSYETVSGSRGLSVDKTLDVLCESHITVGSKANLHVSCTEAFELKSGAKLSADIGDDLSLTTKKDLDCSIGGKAQLVVEKKIAVQSQDELVFKIDKEIKLVCGNASISLKKNGDVLIKGKNIDIKASGNLNTKGSKVNVN